MTKDEIRNKILNLRQSISFDQQKDLSVKICKNIISLELFNLENIKGKNISLFNTFKKEPDLSYLREYLILGGANCYYPVTKNDEIIMAKYDPAQNNQQFELGKLGIREPKNKIKVKNEMDIIIIPGIAFDLNGNRIGFGKGYYDKYLALYKRTKMPKIVAPIYSLQIVKNIQTDDFDIPVDIIVTENDCIFVKEDS